MARTETLQLEVELTAGKSAGSTIKDLNKDLKDANKNLKGLKQGTKEFTAAAKEVGKARIAIKDYKDEVKKAEQSQKGLTSQFLDFIPFGGQIRKVGTAVKFLSGGFKTLRGAIISTGIGALVILFGLLVTWLTTTQKGIDKLTSITRPLQAIFSKLLGVLQNLGGKAFKALSEAIQNPIESLKELGRIIVENVINRFKALALIGPALGKILRGDFAEGFEELGDAAIQMGTGVENGIQKIRDAAAATSEFVKQAAADGARLDKIQKQIERTEITLTTSRANLNKRFLEAKEIAQDLSKTERERVKAARDASAAQNELQDQEEAFLDLKIEKIKLEHSLNDTSREDELELAQLEAERTNFAGQAARKRASAKSLENTALKQISTARIKRIKAEQKAEEEAENKRIELFRVRAEAQKAIESLQISLLEDGLEKRIALLNQSSEAELEKLLENDKITSEQRAEQKQLIELKLKQDTDKVIEDEEKKHQTELAKIEAQALSERNEANELANTERLNEIAEAGLNQLETEQELQRQLLSQALFFEQEKLRILTESGSATDLQIAEQNASILAARQALADAEVKAVEDSESKKQEIREATVMALSDLLSLAADLESTNSKRQQRLILAQQTAAVANVIIGLQQEIAGYLANPASTATFGAAGAIKSGVATLRAGLAIRKIVAAKPSLAKGGVASGPSHRDGGIEMIDNRTGLSVGQMEGNEIILTRGVYRNPVLRDYASRINEMGGGRRFQFGGPINPLNSGTDQISIKTGSQKASSDSSQDLADANIEGTQKIVNAIDELRNDVNTWQRDLKVTVSASEVEEVNDDLANIKAGVDF